MALTKYASFEVSAILGLKGSSERVRTASLDKLSDFEDYRTEDGYLYARIRAISSRVNRNHDGWPSVELAGGPEIFERHVAATGGFTVEASKGAKYGFSTFLGKPVFVDHHNSDPSRARGVIVDAKLHVEDHRTAASHDSYYASSDADPSHLPPTWVELLLEVDAKSFPVLAKAIIAGAKDNSKGIDGFSMGCNVEMSKCSHCGNEATSPDEYCNHIRLKGAVCDYRDPTTGHKTSKRSYENCFGIQFFEISAVFDPADETALTREIRSSVNKEAMDLPMHGGDDALNEAIQYDGPPCHKCKGRGRQHDMMDPRGFTDCADCQGTGALRAGDGYITPSEIHPRDIPFNPADDVDFPMNPRQGKVAQNPMPQDDLLRAPEPIDTLREEKICPVCGSEMDEETCDICQYTEPPEGFDNPDLGKAMKRDQDNFNGLADGVIPQPDPGPSELLDQANPPIKPVHPPRNPGLTAHVTDDMADRWQIVTPHVAGRINEIEQPIHPGQGQATDEPKEQILSDQAQPITSSVRTARDFIEAARNLTEKNMKTADAASGAPEAAAPDKRVDVEGVGGVKDPSNESASKADAQVDVGAQGGTGVENVEADSHDNVDKGNEKSKNIEEIHTDTWSGTGGSAVETQTSPVQGDVFPDPSQGIKKSHDDAPYPKEDGGIAGGGAQQGNQPVAESFGERVDVLDHVTSPANNSGKTDTWSGTDGNGVNRQQDPTTPESIATEGFGKGSAHMFKAFQLAELEVDLGLLAKERKFARVAELMEISPAEVDAETRVARRVKTAGLAKTASAQTVTRLPSLGRSTPVEKTAAAQDDTLLGDSALFS